ncbi:hypothetical protein M440DRAFT_1403560 [Trichoderma longibrachiatum ATCC 18648]|uniref:Uncharacterized protein n=1 Tax=Trichoderma longibrachiatum ATCC 18648 TaxID=983965 RepID=A0A2T4BXZ8_TRILO|nr:hypothetical protein M440DRAFT_1403560 [Trichoderma longibrachiatum ATCC 18648]
MSFKEKQRPAYGVLRDPAAGPRSPMSKQMCVCDRNRASGEMQRRLAWRFDGVNGMGSGRLNCTRLATIWLTRQRRDDPTRHCTSMCCSIVRGMVSINTVASLMGFLLFMILQTRVANELKAVSSAFIAS